MVRACCGKLVATMKAMQQCITTLTPGTFRPATSWLQVPQLGVSGGAGRPAADGQAGGGGGGREVGMDGAGPVPAQLHGGCLLGL